MSPPEIDAAIECPPESDAESCLAFEGEAGPDSMIGSKAVDAGFAEPTGTAMRGVPGTCTGSGMRTDAMGSEV